MLASTSNASAKELARSDRLASLPWHGFGLYSKDVKALAHTGNEHDYALRILESVDAVNDRTHFVQLVAHFGGIENLSGKRIAVWGWLPAAH